jgi:hypothetical protein
MGILVPESLWVDRPQLLPWDYFLVARQSGSIKLSLQLIARLIFAFHTGPTSAE